MSNAAQNLEPVEPTAAPVNPEPAVPPVAAVPSTPPATPATPQNVLNQPAEPAPPAAPADWPDNWRQLYAGADEKLLKEMERYASPKAALDALIASKQKIRSGELLKKPGEGATPEEIAAWRQQRGVPETPEGYLENLPQGLVIGEDDKELIGAFAKAMHALDLEPSAVHTAVKWYYDTIDSQRQAEYESDRVSKDEATNALRAEYGQDFTRNMNMVDGLLKSLPGKAADALSQAYGPDGISILNNVDVLRGLVDWAHQINPLATTIHGASGPSGVANRLAEIREMQAKDPKKYWSPSIQEEELKLIEIQSKLAG